MPSKWHPRAVIAAAEAAGYGETGYKFLDACRRAQLKRITPDSQQAMDHRNRVADSVIQELSQEGFSTPEAIDVLLSAAMSLWASENAPGLTDSMVLPAGPPPPVQDAEPLVSPDSEE